MEPVLQLALDFLELSRALKAAREAVKGGVQWIEAGTPLVKSEGLESIRALRREFPKAYLIADLKTLDAGRAEFEAAAKAGANCATVVSTGSDSTILECIEAGRNYGIDVAVDLLGTRGDAQIELAKKCQEWGAHHVGLHLPIDDQMRGGDPSAALKILRPHVTIPIAVAGGVNSENAAEVVGSGADIVIVGGAITKSADAAKAARDILKAMRTGVAVASDYYKRGGTEDEIRELFEQVSTPNISDAMHRSGDLPDMIPQLLGAKMAGPCVTVRTIPGDWAKPVEAIDVARPGEVIVIDAGSRGPAVWGELASESCLQRKIAGVVIDGGIRDIDSIRALKFPAFARIVTPTAGEPKGFGEINVPIKIGNVQVAPGDWIVGDESGVVRIPKARAVEIANRAMDVLEKENRLRGEIRAGGTLAKITELIKWEKQILSGPDPSASSRGSPSLPSRELRRNVPPSLPSGELRRNADVAGSRRKSPSLPSGELRRNADVPGSRRESPSLPSGELRRNVPPSLPSGELRRNVPPSHPSGELRRNVGQPPPTHGNGSSPPRKPAKARKVRKA